MLEALGASPRGGALYLATDTQLARDVHLHALPREQSAGAALRFAREARLAATIAHPNAQQLYDVDVQDGRPLLFLEPLVGPTLLETIQDRGRLDVEEAVDLVMLAAQALKAAQRKDLLHGELCPSRIVLEPDGELKVVDLGLVRALHAYLGESAIPREAPAFLAPEQHGGEAAEARSDVYALGAILYYMLAGAPPFVGPTITQTIARSLSAPLSPIGDLPVRFAEPVNALLARLLARPAEVRHADVEEVIDDLRRARRGDARLLQPRGMQIDPATQRWALFWLGIVLGACVSASFFALFHWLP